MSWTKQVCGRIKSDYRYSNTIVYNNFPFPTNVSDRLKEQVEQKAQEILNIRQRHFTSTLADLYDPKTMPDDLRIAHKELNKIVDKSYGKQSFDTEMERLQFLFDLYEGYTAGLFVKEKKKRKIT